VRELGVISDSQVIQYGTGPKFKEGVRKTRKPSPLKERAKK
jgi:hypothetical protein